MQISSSLIPNWECKAAFERYIMSVNKRMNPNSYSIFYVDEEGDEIACNTQTDFDLASQMVKESEKKEIIFLVRLKEQDCASQEEKKEMESDPFEEEMRSITEKHQKMEQTLGQQEVKPAKKNKCKVVKKQAETEHQPTQKKQKRKKILQYVTKDEVIRLIQEQLSLSSSKSQFIEEPNADTVQIAGVFCYMCSAGISIPYYINPQTQAKVCHACEPTYDSKVSLVKIRNQMTAIQLAYVSLTEVAQADLELADGKTEDLKMVCTIVVRKTKDQFNRRIKQSKSKEKMSD